MENKAIYSRNYNLRTSDFSCYDELQPHAVLDLFQDVAGLHADILDIGFDKLINRDLIWVLVRTKFVVLKNPKMHDQCKTITWPKQKGKVDFDREYLIVDQNNEVLVKGISKWVIVNYKTRRISLTRDIDYNCIIHEESNFNEPFNKIDDFDIENLPYLEQVADYVSSDHNGHLNNINYARYVVNIMQLKKDEHIDTFEINYVKEVKEGEIIKNYFKKVNNIYYIKGIVNDQTCYLCKVSLK